MADRRDNAREYWNRFAKNYDRSMRLLGGPIPRMVGLVAEGVCGVPRVLEVAAGTGLGRARSARSHARAGWSSPRADLLP